MKKLIILLAVTFFALPAYAQQRDNKEVSNKKHHEMMQEATMHKTMMQMCKHHMMKNDMDLKSEHTIHQNQMKNKSCPMNKRTNSKKSPYAGQQNREIKALSAKKIRGYLQGRGMGFSKVAELNSYPGPKHVLALSEKLNLSENQKEQIKEIFHSMKTQAKHLGRRIVEMERLLDELFSKEKTSKSKVKELLEKIGELNAELRFTHVKAHIKTKEILSSMQVKHYNKIRGYYSNTGKEQPMQNHHSHNT